MKSKLSWVTFILFTPVAAFCMLAHYIAPQGSFFGLSDLMLDYLFIGAVVLIFLFGVLFCVIDKKISTYYIPHRNIPAGVIGIFAALVFAGDGADKIFRMISSGSFEILSVIDSVLLLLSAVVFIVLGLTHSLRSGSGKRFVLFNIMPALLFAERMISCFVGFTTISIRLADVPKMACYIFATLFFFNYAVALSLTKTKNAVKSCIIYGFPAITSLLVYGAVKLIFNPDTQAVVNNAEALEMVLIGAYVLAFMIELTIFVKDKDSVVVSEDDNAVPPDDDVEGFVVGGAGENEDESETPSSYLTSADTEDYLYTEIPAEDDADAVHTNDVEGYLTTATAEDEFDDRPEDYEAKLDRIDKMILEITENSD